MGKLHFYKKGVKGVYSKVADGDGDLKIGGFKVVITDKKVIKGTTYQVREGQGTSGDNYPCDTGAAKGGTAEFGKKQVM